MVPAALGGKLIRSKAHRDRRHARLAAGPICGCGDEIRKAGVLGLDEKQVGLWGHRVRPLDVQGGLQLPGAVGITCSGGVLSRVVRAAVLRHAPKRWRVGQAKCLIEML